MLVVSKFFIPTEAKTVYFDPIRPIKRKYRECIPTIVFYDRITYFYGCGYVAALVEYDVAVVPTPV